MRKCEVCRTPCNRTVCSNKCLGILNQRFSISADELRQLVWSMPTIEVARKFGVSGAAIAKRCKKLGVEKPPRGYWRKVDVGKIKNGKEVNEIVPCGCGCGVMVTKWGTSGKPRRCVQGHNKNGRNTFRRQNVADKLSALLTELKGYTDEN